MKRVYISGPMTGIEELNFPAFNRAAVQLRELGFLVINPVELNPDPSADWHMCLRDDITALMTCDTIAMLPGWEGSNGAHLEVHIAHRVGIRVISLADLVKHASAAVMEGVMQCA